MKKNKILALFLAMVMLLSLGTLAVSASDEEVTATEISTAEELYDFMTSTSGDDVYCVLVNDITYDLTSYMAVTTDKYLDLNNFTITTVSVSANYLFMLKGTGLSFTAVNGSIILSEDDRYAISTSYSYAGMTLDIDNVYFEANNAWCFPVYVSDYTVANVSNCVFNVSQGGAIRADGAQAVNVYDCVIIQDTLTGYSSSAFATSYSGTINVYSGTFICDGYGAYIFSTGGTINIYGGEFEADTVALKADNSTAGSTINVYGGTVDGAISIGSTSTLAIEGGTFANTDLTAEELSVYVTNEDYQVVALADGSLGVVEETCTIDFVANNDTTIDSISGEYGAAITMPTDPTLDGYTFTGWYTDADCTAEFTDETFTSTATLYAGWEEIVVEEEDEFDFFAFWQMIVDFFQRIYDYFYVIIN